MHDSPRPSLSGGDLLGLHYSAIHLRLGTKLFFFSTTELNSSLFKFLEVWNALPYIAITLVGSRLATMQSHQVDLARMTSEVVRPCDSIVYSPFCFWRVEDMRGPVGVTAGAESHQPVLAHHKG